MSIKTGAVKIKIDSQARIDMLAAMLWGQYNAQASAYRKSDVNPDTFLPMLIDLGKTASALLREFKGDK